MFHIPARACPDDPAPQTGGIPRLAAGQLHEVHADAQDWAGALAFGLGAIATDARRPVLVLRVRRRKGPGMDPCGEGWTALGLDPARLILVETRDDAGLLRAGLDAVREGGLAAVLFETWGRLRDYDLVAGRRLILAAERSRIPVIVLRGDAEPRASAAHTRWRVASAPSVPLEMRAPGPPALLVELERRRGGPGGLRWRMEWSERDGAFREAPGDTGNAAGAGVAPLSGAVVSFPALPARAPLRRSA